MDISKELKELQHDLMPKGPVRFAAGTVVSFGAASAIFSALNCALPNTKGVTKLVTWLGMAVLSAKAGDIAEEYFDDVVDSLYDAFMKGKEGDEASEPARA